MYNFHQAFVETGRHTNMYSGEPPSYDKNKIIYGNHSRFGANWISGPNHMINESRVPGYTGHIKGLISENLNANSFGVLATKALTKRHPVGHDLSPKFKFRSHNQDTYKVKNFRRFSKLYFIDPNHCLFS